MEELKSRVLRCANKVSGKSLSIPDHQDLPLEAFHFDSLSTFAFMIELENEFGVSLDETLFAGEEMKTVGSTASMIARVNPQAG